MGIWGTGPFDNDGAGDFIAKTTKLIEKALENESYYYEARACAQFLLLSHNTDVLGGPGLVNVVKLLVKMRSDKEWISGWRSPRKIADVLDKEIEAVLDRMRVCKGCRRGGAASALNEARAIVESAPVWEVPMRRVNVGLKVHHKRTTRAKITIVPKKSK